MREISTEEIKVGEHLLIDGVECVVEKYDGCSECAFNNTKNCDLLPCCTGGSFSFKKVEKEPTYRPYKDTEEMIADYKERFKVSNVPDFCMPLIWVKGKPPVTGVSLASSFRNEFVLLGEFIYNMENLFDDFTYLDGSPCGKVEE